MENLNFSLELLRQDIINKINNSNLPAGSVYYMLKDLFRSIEISYFDSLAEYQQENLNQDITEDLKNENG